MNNRVLPAALAGCIVTFLGSWVVYGMLLDPYFKEQTTEAGAAIIRPPEEMLLWAMAISNLIYSFLLALIFSRWADISTFKTGAIAGAVIGALFALSQGFMWYGYSTMMKGMGSIPIDAVAQAVLGALTGGVVGWVLGYKRD